jgi:DNA (cytosine-5)-methyltransferase 1
MQLDAFYNEIDDNCCAWLSNLMDAGMITPGVICDKSIEDLVAEQLRGYRRVHFFAGVGVWDYALNCAGWGDRPVWTGSCPCQPFSAAGKGEGFADERHLWPAFHHLIRECRPGTIFGEQVASKVGLAWFDLVQTDLEGEGYAAAAVDICAAGIGAPHIRQRLYWVAYANNTGLEGRIGMPECAYQRTVGANGVVSGMAHTNMQRESSTGNETGIELSRRTGTFVGMADNQLQQRPGAAADGDVSGRRDETSGEIAGLRGFSRLPDADGRDPGPEREQRGGKQRQQPEDSSFGRVDHATVRGRESEQDEQTAGVQRTVLQQGSVGQQFGDMGAASHTTPPGGPTNGFWRDADWLFCRDGKWRPVEARIQQVVDGHPLRMGLLCSDIETEIEEALNEAAIRLQTETSEILRTLRKAIDSTHLFEWGGGVRHVHEAQILLAYLLEYEGKKGGEQNATYDSSAGASTKRDVRVLWRKAQTCNPPYQRELAGQHHRKFTDSLRLLSSAVARFASEAGYPYIYENAPASFPLRKYGTYGSSQNPLGVVHPSNRTGRLRAYGNAIVAPQAEEVIRAYMDVM